MDPCSPKFLKGGAQVVAARFMQGSVTMALSQALGREYSQVVSVFALAATEHSIGTVVQGQRSFVYFSSLISVAGTR